MEGFEALRFMRASDLRPDQVAAIRAIRDAIPAPVAGTPMQKVIKGSRVDSMIGADTVPLGFVAKQSDAGTGVFSNSDEMIDGLRLDYDGGFSGESSVGVIEFPMPTGASTEIPYGVGFGGTAIDPYPFAGNGFVASSNGRLTVEYTSSALPPEGAQLFRLYQSGAKIPVATVVSGRWVAVSP